jgi:hypothetical protein
VPSSWAEIRDFGLTLPDAEEITHEGKPALSVRGHMFVRSEPAYHSVIILCTPFERDALLGSGDPSIGIAPRTEGHDYVDLRLDIVEIDSDIRELVTEAWRIAEGQASLD